MKTAQKGTIYSADLNGHFVLKLVGDVRLTLCSALGKRIEKVLCSTGISEVTIDLTEAEGLDSTTLGLVAKLGVQAKKCELPTPVVVSPNPDINKILVTMGFEYLFVLDTSPDTAALLAEAKESETNGDETLVLENGVVLTEIPEVNESLNDIHKRILAAHQVLSDLSEDNREAFKDLVAALETCCVDS